MTIHEPGLYHIYNRGNNKTPIFFTHDNYCYFLRKCHQYLKPYSDILAWCLMTNHFHFLLDVSAQGLEKVKMGGIMMPAITNGFRMLQSTYAKGINKQNNRTGNLFQQKTKAKWGGDNISYGRTAFHYIHQNPVAANLVGKAEQWEYSSFRDYLGLRNGNLCNKQKAVELLELRSMDLRIEAERKIDEETVSRLYS